MYAELRCRTHYSFLRGASHPHEVVERAAELGLPAIAIVDRDGVYGIPKAYLAAQALAEKSRAIQLIVGAELTLAGLPRLALLARDRAGYGLLCRMLTASHEGKEKGMAALEWSRFLELASRKEISGLIALPEEGAYPRTRAQRDYYGGLKDVFADRLYLPLTRALDGRDRRRTDTARRIAAEWDIPIVAQNDVHFHAPERRELHDLVASIRENTPIDRMGRRLFSNGERYLKSPLEMKALFHDLPQAIERTLEVAARCAFCPSELRYRYPSEWIPRGESAQSYLRKLTLHGAEARYGGQVPADVARQLEHELKLIEGLSFADYFLTIWEIVEFAKKSGILCQGRGSAANSAVCYCLGITAIDPVRMNLLFERFISAERGEPPDIDVDFEHERREEVIQHIYSKYGRDRAGMVAALITYRSRSIARDAAKAFGVLPEQWAKEAPEASVVEASAPSIAKAPREPDWRQKLAQGLKGFPRHLSIHSGGFTLSADPLIETVPIEPARMEGRTIVQWDKDDLAAIGLLKVDILALGMLTALQKTFALVAPRRALTLATIPAEDPATYRMIQHADTVGVFQIESRAQMSMLGRLLPATFYDLVIEVAIVRPGPIVGQMVHPYLRRRRGEEPSASPDPRLEPILGRTLGVPLFQEQVMKMAILLAGFTPGEADELRRAIGSWRSSGTLERMGKKLREGLLASGLPPEFVERVFLQIQGFAEYGFPESHAASFALLAYASSYLKCHYPAEFTAALINSQPMGFYSVHTLLEDAKRHGVRVLPVDPRLSDWDCAVVMPEGAPGAIRAGFRVVSGLGEDDARKLVAEREQRPFSNLGDFLARVYLRPRVLQKLAMGGAFACFGFSPREALWEILRHWSYSARAGHPARSAQLGLFDGRMPAARAERTEEGDGAAEKNAFLFPDLSRYEAIQSDHHAFGFSVRGHPMQALRELGGRAFPRMTSQGVKKMPGGRAIRVAGLIIVRQRPPTAKGTAFATLEDEDGFLDLVIHAPVFGKFAREFVEYPFLIVSGVLQRDRHSGSQAQVVIVKRLEPLDGIFDSARTGPHPRELRVQTVDFK